VTPTKLVFDKATSWLYSSDGTAVEASTARQVGVFGRYNAISYGQKSSLTGGGGSAYAIDSTHGRAYFLAEDYYSAYPSGGASIQSFDMGTFSYVASVDIGGLHRTKMLTWGTNGLAAGGGAKLSLVDGPFVITESAHSASGG